MQEAIDAVEAQAQGAVVASKKVKLRPGAYCRFAVQSEQLQLLEEVLALQPPPVITAAAREPCAALGSHRCASRPRQFVVPHQVSRWRA